MNDNLINSLEYTVSELSTSIKRIIEDNFDYIRLKAEVGRVSKPKSGHIYLDLKDDTSVISGIIWKGSVNKLNILPEEGLEVVCTGKVTTYAGQSKYQIIIENIEPYGVGALMALLEKRKEKLLKENLFDDNFKKQIPFLPKRIGVITSPTGAVIRDILHRIEDRFPVNITVWPVKVQGDSSPEEIIDAIEGFHLLDQSNLEKPDVIIIARGGGSVEDLWGFNDEALVRKVFDSKIPIISAIGHETDTTLIDLVADLRAPTPTAAAEMAVPVRKILITSVEDSYERIKNYINNKIEFEERSLLLLDKAIPKIEVMLKNYNLRYKKASSILNISLVSMIKHYQDIFLRKTVSFKANILTKNFNFTKDDFLEVSKSLINSTVNIFDKKTNSLQLQSGLLDVLSHNSVLKRGFAIVKDKKSKIITSSKKIKEDEELMINFYKNDKIKVSLKRDK
ncbi:MAG: exodeoxyribonuclease VII large subunit [Pseudomonadota bacterium]|mgnify:FL=1|jgi:exodeoxyribonuclease VII large subunit|nr:exodeoxyribonuclease VII large subunit [Pseudomonadota bacterium]MED5273057.1 exodeoxyribonuclease VII large subunit [Pseudomonadota bacterium]MED5484498.1 exodeoxyribonuclease VII large subunit [Pseudomonadota bacterium]|tara:strand:- start:1116 stop:2468 length:1353 start_codon:yes stop_codon:yes gene_type:complete